jgi:adenylyltransferase/sulfurtransferase
VTKGIVLVGAGGIGAPAAMALAGAGVLALSVVDDDVVELSNLHRQVLFSDADVGQKKTAAFAAALALRGVRVRVVEGRALPSTARALVRGASVVIDATDNFATRFLLADAAHLEAVPIVHAAAVRWQATVMAVAARGRPCYRCLFEEPPSGAVVDCATAGVAGPVCGVAGAVAADRALRLLGRDPVATGNIVCFDGLADVLREVPVRARAGCPLCGEGACIEELDAARYLGPSCDGA